MQLMDRISELQQQHSKHLQTCSNHNKLYCRIEELEGDKTRALERMQELQTQNLELKRQLQVYEAYDVVDSEKRREF